MRCVWGAGDCGSHADPPPPPPHEEQSAESASSGGGQNTLKAVSRLLSGELTHTSLSEHCIRQDGSTGFFRPAPRPPARPSGDAGAVSGVGS